MIIDMWYGDKPEQVTRLDCFFSDLDMVTRGNLYIGNKMVGDYTTDDSTEIEKYFPQLTRG